VALFHTYVVKCAHGASCPSSHERATWLQPVEKGLCDPDDIPAPPDKATTEPDDLWVLGDHRLLFGDSSKSQDEDRLLDGNTIQLVNADPPSHVKVEPRSNNAIAATWMDNGDGRTICRLA